MEEMIRVLNEILEELQEINSRVDLLSGLGLYGLDDVCDKLDNIESAIDTK